MSITEAFKLFWKRWLDYYGTSSRREFWKAILAWVLIGIVFIFVLAFAITHFNISINPGRLQIISIILSFVIWFPGISLLQRRLNDTGMARTTSSILVWTYILLSFLNFLPFVSLIYGAFGIVLLILCVLPTDYYD